MRQKHEMTSQNCGVAAYIRRYIMMVELFMKRLNKALPGFEPGISCLLDRRFTTKPQRR